MTETVKAPEPAEAPECWCAYGTCGGGIENFGIEVQVPGCPVHDPNGTPEPETVAIDPDDPENIRDEDYDPDE